MKTCKHPPERLFAWHAYNGVLCVGCCVCGEVLRGQFKEEDEMKITVQKNEKGLYEGETEKDKIALRIVTGETYPTEKQIEQAQLPDIQIEVKE